MMKSIGVKFGNSGIIVACLGFLVGCGSQSTFKSSIDSGAPFKQLVAMEQGDQDELSLGLDEFGSDDLPEETVVETVESDIDDNVVVEGEPGKGNGQGNGKNEEDEDDTEADKDGYGQYICILDGPGKSLRLGVASGAPGGQNPIPQVICMSKEACLTEVSRAFTVKMADRRGFCPDKNPHVLYMTDEEITSLIDGL